MFPIRVGPITICSGRLNRGGSRLASRGTCKLPHAVSSTSTSSTSWRLLGVKVTVTPTCIPGATKPGSGDALAYTKLEKERKGVDEGISLQDNTK